jgi:hypothetical protein
MMAGNVFISYRRDDSAGHAGRVHDRLEREFGRDLLFMDIDSVPLGVNFVNVLSEEVAKCDVLLAVIGPNWLNARDEDGSRRLDNPHDFVRIEIGAALQRNIPVIPILLDGAKVPKASQLPKELEELSLRNGLDVRHVSFHNDVDKLVRSLQSQLAEADARRRDEDERRRQEAEDRRRLAEAEAEKRRQDEERRRQARAQRRDRALQAQSAKEAEMQQDLKRGRDKTPDEAAAREAQVQQDLKQERGNELQKQKEITERSQLDQLPGMAPNTDGNVLSLREGLNSPLQEQLVKTVADFFSAANCGVTNGVFITPIPSPIYEDAREMFSLAETEHILFVIRGIKWGSKRTQFVFTNKAIYFRERYFVELKKHIPYTDLIRLPPTTAAGWGLGGIVIGPKHEFASSAQLSVPRTTLVEILNLIRKWLIDNYRPTYAGAGEAPNS